MEKFIILNNTADKYYVGADITYAELVGAVGSENLTLYYKDKTVTVDQSAAATQADVDAINDAVAAVWAQGYTESTIGPLTLSSVVNGIS